MSGPRIVPPPEPGPETAPFWAAAQQGRFLLRRCRACGKFHWYPRDICPFCAKPGTEWVESPGLGRVYSCTVFRRGDGAYAVAYVELDEGPRILTNIVTETPGAVRIGQRVAVRFVPAAEPSPYWVPFFRPLPDDPGPDPGADAGAGGTPAP